VRRDSYGSWWQNMLRTSATRRRRPWSNAERFHVRPRVEELEHRLAPAQLAVTVSPSPVRAGDSFILQVQAEDNQGNPIAMSGTVNFTTTDPQVPTLPPVTLNSTGLGYAADNFLTASATGWTITGTTTGASGTSAAIPVTASDPVKLAFGTQPATTATGDVINPAVTVKLQDLYGNTVTSGSDSTDSVTISVASGPTSGNFTAGSTTSVNMTSGVATFNNLTLVVPGSYALSPLVSAKFVGQNSSTFSVTPLQVVPASFAGTPSGFSVQFNAPFLVTSTTPVLYGQGFGATGQAPSVILTTDPTHLSNTAAYVEGTLVLSTATNSMTFVATNTVLESNSGTSPVLPDGVYTAVIRTGAANNGFQALNTGGGFLDGKATGTAGSGDFTASFTVNAAATGQDVLWVPATANGPGQNLRAPGQNQTGTGYPVYIDDSTGNVTDVKATLNYNPSALTVQPSSSATFTVTVPTAGTAMLHYSGPALAKGSQTSIGLITAAVPQGSVGTPTLYRAKDLLQLSGVSLNNGGISTVIGSNAVHVVAYVGDGDGNGAYSSGDAVLITRVTLQTDTGFTAYPLIDPTIVADTDGSGFIPADAALQANEAGVGFQTANLATPPIPPGVVFQPVPNNVDPSLSIPSQLQIGADGTLTVPVNIDDPHPAGSTGLIEAHLALTYNPGDLTVSANDIHLGSVLAAGSGWTLTPTIDARTGQIAIALSSTTPITSAQGGSLVTIDFHPVGRLATPSPIDLVASASPNGQFVMTELEDAQGTFTLTPAPTNGFDPRIDGQVGGASPAAGLLVSSPVIGTPSLIDSVAPTLPATADAAPDVSEEVPSQHNAAELENTTGPAEAATPITSTVMHAATTGTTLAPLAGLVIQVAGSVPVSLASNAWQRLADQFFQSLGRVMSSANEPALVIAIKDAFDATAAIPALRLSIMADTSDDLGQVGSDLDAQTATASRDTGRVRVGASEDTTADRPASLQALSTAAAERVAVDQFFAQTADEMDQPSDDD
jgi:hypothetical protein